MLVALFWRICWAIFYPLDPDPDPHLLSVSRRQRRRIELEDKAKVVASVCGGQNLFKSFPRYSCFVLVYLKEKVEYILFFQIDWGKTASAARNWTNFSPQTDVTTFDSSSNSILLLQVADSDPVGSLCFLPDPGKKTKSRSRKHKNHESVSWFWPSFEHL